MSSHPPTRSSGADPTAQSSGTGLPTQYSGTDDHPPPSVDELRGLHREADESRTTYTASSLAPASLASCSHSHLPASKDTREDTSTDSVPSSTSHPIPGSQASASSLPSLSVLGGGSHPFSVPTVPNLSGPSVVPASGPGAAATKANPKHAAAVQAFNERFHAEVKSFDVLQNMMSIKEVREWYKEYRVQRSAAAQVPAHLARAGITPAEWAESEPVRAQRKKIRADVAARCAALTREYRAALQAAREEGRTQLAACESALVLAMEAGPAQLPAQAQASVAAAGPEHAQAVAHQLELARPTWVRDARQGTLRFDRDAYPLMPL